MEHNEIYTFKNGINWYDLKKSWIYLQHVAIEKLDTTLTLYPEDYTVYRKLLAYALQDEEACSKFGLDPKKGILLVGKIGVGKTTYMKLLPYLMKQEHRYAFESALNITSDYKGYGEQIIKMYTRPSININHLCIDDLGLEKEVLHFGNRTNVLGEILYTRHQLLKEKGIYTHATTNLNAVELSEKYGNRMRSRMREMFNIVSFQRESGDRRK